MMRVLYLVLLLGLLPAVAEPAAPTRPNILFIMVDDLGPEWISCYGGRELKTPRIDALAAGGMEERKVSSATSQAYLATRSDTVGMPGVQA